MSPRKATFRDALNGCASVRFIYTDEAGISADEPVTIVAALIVHADTQWKLAAERIDRALSKVPDQYRKAKGFVFHAKAIWGDPKIREGWTKEERLGLLTGMMAIPRELGIPLAYGLFYRDGEVRFDGLRRGMTALEYQHAEAFRVCMGCADQYINNCAHPDEVATVVAEDIPEMRKNLQESTSLLRAGTMSMSRVRLETRSGDQVTVDSDTAINLRIRRIVDQVHFTPKISAPLLQLADAVAFGLRRYYANQTLGLEFGRAVMGPDIGPPIRNKDCACGYMCLEEIPAAPFDR